MNDTSNDAYEILINKGERWAKDSCKITYYSHCKGAIGENIAYVEQRLIFVHRMKIKKSKKHSEIAEIYEKILKFPLLELPNSYNHQTRDDETIPQPK